MIFFDLGSIFQSTFFDQLAGHYFLREILDGSAAMNLSLPASKTEKRVAMEEARLNKSHSRVMVAIK